MKNLLFILFVFVVLSCDNDDTDLNTQIVTYRVKCDDCLVYIEDDKWNRHNELDRSKSQYLNVVGELEYSFENTSMDSVSARVLLDVFSAQQKVFVEIHESKYNRKAILDEVMGMPKNPFQEYKLEKTISLDLK